MSKHSLASTMARGLLAALMAACALGAAAQTAPSTIVIGMGPVPRHLNSAVQSGIATGIPATQIFASPLRFDKDWTPQPYLAESWVFQDDGNGKGQRDVTDTRTSMIDRAAGALAEATPLPMVARVKGLSDRTVAWLFIAPTMLLLLAINIFPLIWAIWLSFTNYRANRPNEIIKNVGLSNYQRIL
eukprot:gene55175-73710_t